MLKSTVVDILLGMLQSLLRKLEPLLIEAVQKLVAGWIARAKSQQLPERYQAFQPVLTDLENKLGDFVTADHIKAELDKLIPQAS